MREQVMIYAKEKYGEDIPNKTLERLEYEFEKIESSNLDSDLIVLSEIIKEWRHKDYFINVTFPFNNSVVIYLLGMLDIDPMMLNNLLDLDFTNKQLGVVVSKDIREELLQSTKERLKNIEIKPYNWFRVELLNYLEKECNKYSISLDDNDITKKAIREEKIGTPLCYYIETYAISSGFGVNGEKFNTFYDYINYDNNNGGYSTDILIAYYLAYYEANFPDKFYQIYIDCLMDVLPDDPYLETREKMLILHDYMVKIFDKGYRLDYW